MKAAEQCLGYAQRFAGAHQRSKSRRAGTSERDSGYTCGQREHGRARAGLPWPAVVVADSDPKTCGRSHLGLGMKTDRIRTDITDIVFVFVFMSGFGFEYG
jgi:hypothetical protein